VIRETVLSASIAGLIAAIIFTIAQSVWVTPLILQAETYEDAAPRESHGDAGATDSPHEHAADSPHERAADSHHDGGGADHDTGGGHHHDADAWKPEDGWQRTLFTFGANLLMGVGYAFVLSAVFLLWREPKSAAAGALYGLAGFAVFFAAPTLGLPPELPGTAAADLTARQQWWVMTAGATAAGLILLAAQPRWSWRLLALALLVAPHLVPAPHPAMESSLAPADLQSRFRLTTTLCNAVFWLSLGIASALTFRKSGRPRIRQTAPPG